MANIYWTPHLIFTDIPCNRFSLYLCFIDMETNEQRGYMPSQRLLSL